MTMYLAENKPNGRLCELCQGRASLECAQCRVTFYCDASHMFADWVGIHEKICPLLVPIRTWTLRGSTGEGRIEMDIKKVLHLSEAKACLSLCVNVFGSSTIELVPAYLLLAEAYLGLGKLSPAAEMISQAEWVVSKSLDCDHELNHRLHRALGRLQTAKGNFDDASLSFANDIYHAAKAYGLESTVCRYGYFLIANVFAKKGKTLIARSMYKEVAQIWHSHLTKLMQPFLENPEASPLPTFGISSWLLLTLSKYLNDKKLYFKVSFLTSFFLPLFECQKRYNFLHSNNNSSYSYCNSARYKVSMQIEDETSSSH
uniref:MYND-type domain-containing protein n=1 Tax=Neogobius melanostomus TaxID=47308 RepID=A0A8C6SDS2_9GOBI